MPRYVIHTPPGENTVKQKQKRTAIFAAESDNKKPIQKSQQKMRHDDDFFAAKIIIRNHKSDGLFLF